MARPIGRKALATLAAFSLAAVLAPSAVRPEFPSRGGVGARAAADPDAEPNECRVGRTGKLGPRSARTELPLCSDDVKSGTWQSETTTHFKAWWRKEDGPSAHQVAKLALKTFEGSVWPTLTRFVGREPVKETPDFCAGKRLPGGDARLDIYVIDLGESDDAQGLTTPLADWEHMPPDAPLYPAAGYIRLDRHLLDNEDPMVARMAMAHEFFHILQFTFGPKPLGKVPKDWWWTEASATWASTLVVPELRTFDLASDPSLLCEYLATASIRMPDDNPRSAFPKRRHYGSALFPLFLIDRQVPKSFILDSWNRTSSQEVVSAVDQAIPGGYARWWNEFALFLLNRPPYDRLSQLGSPKKVRTEKVAFGKTADVERFFAPAKLEGLSATYYHLRLGPESRLVGYQPLPLPAGVSLQVLRKKKTDAKWSPAEDWSRAAGKIFCREVETDRFDELLLVFANSNLEASSIPSGGSGGQPIFLSSGRPCAGWQGTHTSEARLYANLPTAHFQANTVAKVTYRLATAGWVDGKASLIYRADRPNVTTWYSSTVCTCPAQPTTGDIAPGQAGFWLQDVFATGPQTPQLVGSGFAQRPLACVCGDGQPKAPPTWDFTWLAIPEEQPAPVSDLKAIRGSKKEVRSLEDGTAFALEQSWDLAPLRP